ncbi:MAG TPA: hypothetical protein VF819_04045 [Nitrospira sp.]
MERRAASHTEEEEMNQRRRLLNAAKKGDQKAVAKLFELYQVKVYNSEMVNKLNRTAGTHKLQASVAKDRPGKAGRVRPSRPAPSTKPSQKKTHAPASKTVKKSKPAGSRAKKKAHKK